MSVKKMRVKKLFLFFASLWIALSTTAGSWALASAAVVKDTVTQDLTFQEVSDVFLGKGGVFMPSSAYTGVMELTRIDLDNKHPARDLDFVQNWMDVRLYDNEGAEFQRVFGLVYVYFNLNNETRAAWKNGDLNIYRYDPKERVWEACEVTRLIPGKNQPHGRLACVVSDFGLYGLAVER